MAPSNGYPLFIPARHGLGDNLFSLYGSNAWIFHKIYHAHLLGMLDAVLAVYEEFMNPSIPELFSILPFPVQCVTTAVQEGVNERGSSNEFPAVLPSGHRNIFLDLPEEIYHLKGIPYEFPIVPIEYDLPDKYIHFVAEAGREECVLTDPAILNCIRSVSGGLPIVQTGKSIPRSGGTLSNLTADVDLRNRANIYETLYIARNADVGISSVSFLRVASFVFGLPVIEIIQSSGKTLGDDVLGNQEVDYSLHRFGINAKGMLNYWVLWPEERQELERLIPFILEERQRHVQRTS
jgi:hypothetical protein